MHDARNRKLKVGDFVLIPAVIVETSETEDFCNMRVQTFFARRPDNKHEHLDWINSAVALRASASFYERDDSESD